VEQLVAGYMSALIKYLPVIAAFVAFAFSCMAGNVTEMSHPKPINPDDPKGLKLPAGVPRTVDTNGNVIAMYPVFTTRKYQMAAVKLMVEEANNVAKELQLSEDLPITASNLTEAIVFPFSYKYEHKRIGNITTKYYFYGFDQDNKLDAVGVAQYDKTYAGLSQQLFPPKEIDYNGAYQLATQRLAAISIDVNGLNRDCKVHLALSSEMKELNIPRGKFAPVYFIWWTSPKNDAEHSGDAAYVELFAPSNKLLQLSVRDPKYILRKPLQFTNLESLFPGTAPIHVFTNYPPTPTGVIETVH
jgi:hypothetical protein